MNAARRPGALLLEDEPPVAVGLVHAIDVSSAWATSTPTSRLT